MDGGHAGWNAKTTKLFLDLCIDEKNKFNCTKKGLTRQGWDNVYRLFLQQMGRTYDKKQLQNKFNSLKKTYRLWRTLKGKSGLGWDNTTGTITETPEWWAERIAENSEYKQFLNRGLPHEDDLDTLFSSMISEEGTILCVGGVGDRTPSGGSDGTPGDLPNGNDGWSEDDIGWSSVGRVSQRSGKEQVVDSPPAKKTKSMEYCVQRGQRSGKEQVADSPPPKKTKSMEYYVQRISESMLERCKNETEAMTREEREMTELLQLLEEDGVPRASELYYIATKLLRTASRRIAFKRFTTAEERLG